MKRFIPALILVIFVTLACNLFSPPDSSPVQTEALPGNPESSPTQPANLPATADISKPIATQAPAPAQPAVLASPSAPPVQAPVEPPAAASLIAYSSNDGNLWLINGDGSAPRQLTQDPAIFQHDKQKQGVLYCCLQWSSDGKLLAYQRQVDQADAKVVKSKQDLWLFDNTTGKSRVVMENLQVAGYNWKPGTHQITFGKPIPQEYFTGKAETASKYALGIWTIDVDNGQVNELVKPERGFSLVNPTWSQDGLTLSFDEVQGMEGRGQFAYYDFQAQKYIAWGKVIGSYVWSPDGQRIAYDNMAYIPSGTERIYLNNRQGSQEQALSPKLDKGYAFNPVFSPKGDRVAYLQNPAGLENTKFELIVQPVSSGEPHPLGSFEQVSAISWFPAGNQLLISVGPFETPQILMVNPLDGVVKVLAKGSQPTLQP